MQNQHFDIQDFINFLSKEGHRIGNNNVTELAKDQLDLETLYRKAFRMLDAYDIEDLKTILVNTGINKNIKHECKHKVLKLLLNLNFNEAIELSEMTNYFKLYRSKHKINFDSDYIDFMELSELKKNHDKVINGDVIGLYDLKDIYSVLGRSKFQLIDYLVNDKNINPDLGECLRNLAESHNIPLYLFYQIILTTISESRFQSFIMSNKYLNVVQLLSLILNHKELKENSSLPPF